METRCIHTSLFPGLHIWRESQTAYLTFPVDELGGERAQCRQVLRVIQCEAITEKCLIKVSQIHFRFVDCLLCRYYSVRGIELARDLASGHIEHAFKLIFKRDPNDVWQGFLKMAVTLNYLGDDQNALGAFSLLNPIYMNAPIVSEV